MPAPDVQPQPPATVPPVLSRNVGDDWVVATLAALTVAGGYLADWAANHRHAADSLFSPWRAALDAGFLLVTVALVAPTLRHRQRGTPRRATAAGSGLGLAGVFVAFLGLGLTPVWQALFGAGDGLAGIISPPVFLTALGIALVAAVPLAAAWRRLPPGVGTWTVLGPALLSALTFVTQFAHPLVRADAASVPSPPVPQEVYAVTAQGTGQHRLTVLPPSDDFGPSWSPDGQRIIFARGTPAELDVMHADGSDQVPLTHLGRNSYLAHWSPDGTRIVFISQVGDDLDTAAVYTVNADGSNPTALTHAGKREYGAVWSPDGRRIAFGSLRDGSWQVYVMEADGSTRPDGRARAATSRPGRRMVASSCSPRIARAAISST